MPKKQPVIAIVDDDASVREAIMSLLRALDFGVEAYPCAEDFLKSGRLDRASCLIADVRMPGMTGLELYCHLVGSGTPIPTILITAHADDRVRARARSASRSYSRPCRGARAPSVRARRVWSAVRPRPRPSGSPST